MVPETAFFIGDVAFDHYFLADRWPGVADKAYVDERQTYLGGMIANAASVFAGFGGRAEFISLLNTSAMSQRLCDELNSGGVATTHMLRGDVSESQNLIFLVHGEHVVLTVNMGTPPMLLAEAALQALRAPGYLYTTLNRAKRLRAGVLQGPELLADLRQHGRRPVFDLDVEGFSAADIGFLDGAEVLVMNEKGFALSFGPPDLSAINDWMQRHQVRTIIRTLAAEGAEAYDGHGVTRVPGYRIPVTDVTGAGDTFGGALVYGLAQGQDLATAMDFAIAAASRSVMIEGPRGGVTTVATVTRFQQDFAASRG